MPSLFRKLLVYQIFILTPIIWFLDNTETKTSEFGSSLTLVAQHFKIDQLEKIVGLHADHIFYGLIGAQFLMSVLGLVICKCLGSVGGLIYLLVSAIKYNPLKAYPDKELFFGVKYELLLSLAAFLALLYLNSAETKAKIEDKAEETENEVKEDKKLKKTQNKKDEVKKDTERTKSSEKSPSSKKKKMD